MPGQSDISRGNLTHEGIYSVNIAAGTVTNTQSAIVTVAFPGVLPGDYLSVTPQEYLWPASQPAVNVCAEAAWCATPNVLSVSFSSASATVTTITQTTPLIYTLNLARAANFSINGTLPTALV